MALSRRKIERSNHEILSRVSPRSFGYVLQLRLKMFYFSWTTLTELIFVNWIKAGVYLANVIVIIYNHWDSDLSQGERWAKVLHNQKHLVSKVCKKYKIIEIDLRNTPTKYSPKLDESLRKKVTHFVLKLRQAKNRVSKHSDFSFVGFSGFPLERAHQSRFWVWTLLVAVHEF